MAPRPHGTTYAFTDPLGASDAAGTRERIRRAHALVCIAAVPILLLALLTDDGSASQRLATGVVLLVCAALATALLSWRAPDWVLLGAFPFAAVTVTAIAVLDPPLALTPMFYVWPLMTAAYFLQRREVLITYATVCGSFGVAALWVLPAGTRLIQWITVAVIAAVVVGFVDTLKVGLHELVDRLHALAREDPLTGALNRRAFMERLEAELARVARTGTTCAVAVIDVDHFKTINDRFGHAAGDAALRRLADTLSRRLRRGDVLGRMGGEEFAVLLTDADGDGAETYADELRILVGRDAAAAGTPFTVSVGVAATPPGGTTADSLLTAADVALYSAKHAGRDTVRAA